MDVWEKEAGRSRLLLRHSPTRATLKGNGEEKRPGALLIFPVPFRFQDTCCRSEGAFCSCSPAFNAPRCLLPIVGRVPSNVRLPSPLGGAFTALPSQHGELAGCHFTFAFSSPDSAHRPSQQSRPCSLPPPPVVLCFIPTGRIRDIIYGKAKLHYVCMSVG
ncbi:hypothetical protein H8959_009488 [Pygathrix nigripes]